MTIGDRVTTPTGKTGVLVASQTRNRGRTDVPAWDVLIDPFWTQFAGETGPSTKLHGLVVTWLARDLTPYSKDTSDA